MPVHVSKKYEWQSEEREQLIRDGYLHEGWRDVFDVWPILQAQGKDFCARLVVPYKVPGNYPSHSIPGFFDGTCECNDCRNGTGLTDEQRATRRRKIDPDTLRRKLKSIATTATVLFLIAGGKP